MPHPSTRPTGPMLRLLRRIAAGQVPVVQPTDGVSPNGAAGRATGVVRLGLVETVERDGVAVYVLTDRGRQELAATA